MGHALGQEHQDDPCDNGHTEDIERARACASVCCVRILEYDTDEQAANQH